ncbi:Protein phosphatase 1A [Perkinsus olseni]|uniref:Protein phosphatase 1A n=1 Tax=Perkinsus olseni TaxID=32597 RepID=A0A7J6RK16_PEROL|nr:Protein phosphatase 1A [Perkinsus olseni]
MGGLLSHPVTAVHLQRRANDKFECGVATLQGWRVSHEDAHCIDLDWGLTHEEGFFAVLDGHTGDDAAEFGAQELPKQLSESAGDPEDRTVQGIQAGFLATDEALRQSHSEAGAVVVASIVGGKGVTVSSLGWKQNSVRQGRVTPLGNGKYKVRIMNAGDSRAVVFSGKHVDMAKLERAQDDVTKQLCNDDSTEASSERGLLGGGDPLGSKKNLAALSEDDVGLLAATKDHKPDDPEEKARIEEAGGFVSSEEPARLCGVLALSRGLGDFAYKDDADLSADKQKCIAVPDVREVVVEAGDWVVLACDGVFDVMSNEDVAREVMVRAQSGQDLAEIATEVLQRCLNLLDSKDNMTCMIIRVGTSELGLEPEVPDERQEELQLGGYSDPQTLAPGMGEKYQAFFRKAGFSKNPAACSTCSRVFRHMAQCPCKNAVYCGVTCQKKGWKDHKKVCKAVKGNVPASPTAATDTASSSAGRKGHHGGGHTDSSLRHLVPEAVKLFERSQSPMIGWGDTPLTPSRLLGMLDAAEIDQMLLSAWVRPGGIEAVSNEKVRSFTTAAPDRFFGLAAVDLDRPVEAARLIEKAVKDDGFVGVRIMPWLWDRPPTHETYYPIYLKCVELGVPLCTQVGHTGPARPSDTGRPIPYIDRVALHFPELRIVCGHIGHPWLHEMMSVMWKHENIFLDTSAYLPKMYGRDLLAYMHTKSGSKKVMFGTNFPQLDLKKCMQQVHQLGLPPDAKDRFLTTNAQKLNAAAPMSGGPDPSQGLGALTSPQPPGTVTASHTVTSPPPTSGPSSAAAIAAAAVLLQQQQQQSGFGQPGLPSADGAGKNGSDEENRAVDEAFMRCKRCGLVLLHLPL